MLGRTLADGQRHEVRWEADRLDRTIESSGRRPAIAGRRSRLHALVQQVMVTPDRHQRAEEMAQRTGMTVEDILATPYLCIGTHDDMAEHLIRCRDRWNISYYSRALHRRLCTGHRGCCASEPPDPRWPPQRAA